jgi:TPR repeat protein
MAFERGLGTDIDLVEANKWLRRAALTDNADGVRAYARFIVEHADLALVPEAVEFWQARARKIERG